MNIRYLHKLEVQRANEIPLKTTRISKTTAANQELVSDPDWLKQSTKGKKNVR